MSLVQTRLQSIGLRRMVVMVEVDFGVEEMTVSKQTGFKVGVFIVIVRGIGLVSAGRSKKFEEWCKRCK
jgi:hypothetical protein